MRGTHWAEIVPDLAPAKGDLVVEKQTYSPFVSSDIEVQLRQRGITRLFMTGLHTDCCVRHTSGDAFQRGFGLVWISDAMQAFTDEAHQTGLEYFKAWYATDAAAQLRTTDQVLEDWGAAVVR
jgi:nicotinamidase-related amidase